MTKCLNASFCLSASLEQSVEVLRVKSGIYMVILVISLNQESNLFPFTSLSYQFTRTIFFMNCILLTFDRTYHYHTDERQSYLFSDIQKCDNNLQNFQTDFEWNVAIFNRGEINVTLKTLTCTVNDRITFWGKSGWTNWNLQTDNHSHFSSRADQYHQYA